MVLTTSRSTLVSLLLCGLMLSGCLKQAKTVTRVLTPVPVDLAWVVDLEEASVPADPPAALQEAGSEMLAARNLQPTLHDAEDWAATFGRQRASSLRMAWLDQQAPEGGLLALVELRPYYDNTSQGRYRWIVAVRATVAPANAPERELDVQFEVPVFLRFIHQGADQAMAEARLDIVRRLARLIDGVLQDPEGGWPLSEPVGASTGTPSGRWVVHEGGAAGDPVEAGLQGPIYFVMLDRFANGDLDNDDEDVATGDPQGWHGGDLRGLIDHLDHLDALGVRTVWLSPLTVSQDDKAGATGPFHGYWMRDPAALDPRWGTEDELRELRKGLDARGMKLVLDVVTNHVAYDSPLPRQRPDWFHGKGPITDWQDPVQAEQGDVHGLPDLDQDNPAVARWLTEAAQIWIERARPDGFRLDAVRHVSIDFWAEYNREVGKLGGKGFALLGELFEGRPDVISDVWRRGRFRQMFDFPLHYAMVESICGGAHLGKVGSVLSLDRLYDRPDALVTFLDNHDLPRVMTACGDDRDKVLDALAVQLGLRGIPAITWGTEVGLRGDGEPENRADMVFRDPGPLHARIKRASRLRAEHPALRGDRSIILAARENLLAVLRLGEGEAVLVVLNRGKNAADVTLPSGFPAKTATTLLGEQDAEVGLAKGVITVPAGGARWVWVEPKSAKALERWVEKATAPSLQTVSFEVTGFNGEALAVVGGAPELGLWQATHGARLERTGDRWTGQIEVPRDTVLEFKLVGLGAEPVWESRANRYLQVRADREPVVLAWNQGG
jgi:glycosidase